VRQGDPISPYLFVLCMNRLAQLICASVEAHEWRPISVGRGAVQVPFLMFADDLLLFTEASDDQAVALTRILCQFSS
ncbi:Uncharacterized mitochondrial protein AtMg01250, partial [Striga hermonthica]